MRKMFYVFLITLIVAVFFSFGAGTVSAQYIFHEFGLKNQFRDGIPLKQASYTTKLSDTRDYTIVSTITSRSDTRDTVSIAVSVDTIPENGEGGWEPTLDKKLDT